MAKRKRRSFTKEYKAEVVELIRKSGKSVGAVVRELDLTETAARRWIQQAETDSGGGAEGALTTAEREELGRLRKQVKTLEMEREILKVQLRSHASRPKDRADVCASHSRKHLDGLFWLGFNALGITLR